MSAAVTNLVEMHCPICDSRILARDAIYGNVGLYCIGSSGDPHLLHTLQFMYVACEPEKEE